MKLIIDIPEDVYTECQGHIYFPDTGGELFNAVKNGTPLDDVKAEIGDLRNQNLFGIISNYELLDVVLEIIDKYIGKAESEK